MEDSQYREADRERVVELHEEALRETGTFAEGTVDEDLHAVESTYIDSGGDFLVGILEEEIIAMGAFRSPTGHLTEYFGDLPETTAEIKRMRVDPEQQRRGYGQRIYDELERRAKTRGITNLVLDTSPDWEGARRFYEKNSFEAVRQERIQSGTESFELVFYRKSLGESD